MTSKSRSPFLIVVALAALVPGVVTSQPAHSRPICGDRSESSKKQHPEAATAFVNGYWFNGYSFVPRTGYVVRGGILTFQRPAHLDSTVDLEGRYVIPPFGEAHNHNLDNASRIVTDVEMYLRDGIFYAKNQNILRRFRTEVANDVNCPVSVDVVYANGGLAHRFSHVVDLYRRRSGLPPDQLEGEAYSTIADRTELERKWDAVVAGKPDFIKTFLEYSEEYERRQNDSTFFGRTGLDPAVLVRIVERAHAAGLRVSAHIETAADFRTAVMAGVDEIAHLPGYDVPQGDSVGRYRLTPHDARLAARNRVVVVTTVSLGGIRHRNDPERLRIIMENHRENLALLHQHGVHIAIGSDSYRTTSVSEAFAIRDLHVFDNLTLIKLWCEETPRTIFPRRKIGQLAEGSEASFLVLDANPLLNFDHVREISLRVKQGRILDITTGGS